MLDAQSIEQIVNDFSHLAEHILIWLDNFDELGVDMASICSARRLVSAIRSKGVAVEVLYGGYLMMLMQDDGMGEVSHGILYTQHKGFDVVPGAARRLIDSTFLASTVSVPSHRRTLSFTNTRN